MSDEVLYWVGAPGDKNPIYTDIPPENLRQKPDQNRKTDQGKPNLLLIPLKALRGVARVMEYGNRKYAKNNWTQGELNRASVERYLAAALRHLSACTDIVEDGEHDLGAIDPESGLPHLDHAIASLIIARWYAREVGLLKGISNP